MKKINVNDLKSQRSTEASLRWIACNVQTCSPTCSPNCGNRYDMTLSALDAKIGYSAQGGQAAV